MADPETTARWDRIIDHLRGSCGSLIGALRSHDAEDLEDHQEFLRYLDDEIFLCETCGWWCEMSEMAEDEEGTEPTCSDCSG